MPGFNYDPNTKAPFSNTAEFGGTIMYPKSDKRKRMSKMDEADVKKLKIALAERKMKKMNKPEKMD